ncbi:MAG: efflux RND transporter periplasmic adaptor subunit [Gammaproteobacteria bacterium]
MTSSHASGLRRLLPPALLFVCSAAAAAPITLDRAQQQLLNVTTAPAVAARTVRVDGLLGEVTLPVAGSLALAAPWPGRVVQVLADEGDAVARDAVLAWVESPAMAELRTQWRTARVERDLAASRTERDRALLAEGIIPAARAEASAAELAAREAALGGLADILGDHASAAHGAARYPLRAPFDATVVTRRVAAGDAIEAFATAFMLLADDGLRLDLQVPAPLAALAAPGTAVELEGGGADTRVTISGRAARVDPDTQTVTVRAAIAAGSPLLPGQRVTATLALPAPAGAVEVPRGALVQQADAAYVYRATDDRFETVTVTLHGESAAGAVISAAGLSAGDAVVVSGTSALRTLAE